MSQVMVNGFKVILYCLIRFATYLCLSFIDGHSSIGTVDMQSLRQAEATRTTRQRLRGKLAHSCSRVCFSPENLYSLNLKLRHLVSNSTAGFLLDAYEDELGITPIVSASHRRFI